MKVPSPRRFTFPLFVNEVWCGFVDIYVLDACVIEKKLYWEKDILMLTSMSKFWQSAQTNSVQQCGINPKSFFLDQRRRLDECVL